MRRMIRAGVVLAALAAAAPAGAGELAVEAPAHLRHEIERCAAARVHVVARAPGVALLRARVERHAVTFTIVERGAPPLVERLAHATPARVAAAVRALVDRFLARAEAPPAASAAIAQPAPAARPADVAPAPSMTPMSAATEAPGSAEPAPAAGLGLARSAAPRHEATIAVWLDGGVVARRLRFDGLTTRNLSTYDNGASALVGFHAELQPFARGRSRWLRGLALAGGFAGSVASGAAHADGSNPVQSPLYAFDVGLRERVRLGDGRFAPALGVAAAYGSLRQSFSDGGVLVAGLPSVSYQYGRVAVDGEIALGPLALELSGGYRAVGSSGYLGSRFSRTSVQGFDARAGLVARLPRGVVVGAGAEYVRFASTFHPQPGDAYVANGAVDEILVARADLGWSY
ncbi:MAG TPA: hypothetical protein VN947_17225 [Polyangia bacterium]|nr:hypothetical protein [Polyangia bacterium]